MLASQGHDKEMQRRRFAQEGHAAAQPQRQKLQLRALAFTSHQQLLESPFVESVTRPDRQGHDALSSSPVNSNRSPTIFATRNRSAPSRSNRSGRSWRSVAAAGAKAAAA